jgi:hypothetical protein
VVAPAIANGAHPKEIHELTGHSSIGVTLDTYRHLLPSLGETLADGLEATYRAAIGSSAVRKVTRIDRGGMTRK